MVFENQMFLSCPGAFCLIDNIQPYAYSAGDFCNGAKSGAMQELNEINPRHILRAVTNNGGAIVGAIGAIAVSIIIIRTAYRGFRAVKPLSHLDLVRYDHTVRLFRERFFYQCLFGANTSLYTRDRSKCVF